MEMTDNLFKSFYKEEKVIVDDIIWRKRGGIYETDHVPIFSEVLEGELVTLKCKVDKYNNYSFNIVFKKTIILVRYDKKIHHGNFIDGCSGEKLNEPHKHKFKKDCKRNLEAKIISESEITRGDVNKALMQFLEECNIRLEGNYTPIIISPHKGYIQTYLYEFVDVKLDHLRKGRRK